MQQEARPVPTATMTVQVDMQVWKLQHAGRYLLHVCHCGSGLLFHENIKRSQGRRSMCESVAPVLWLGLLAGAQNERLQIFTVILWWLIINE